MEYLISNADSSVDVCGDGVVGVVGSVPVALGIVDMTKLPNEKLDHLGSPSGKSQLSCYAGKDIRAVPSLTLDLFDYLFRVGTLQKKKIVVAGRM